MPHNPKISPALTLSPGDKALQAAWRTPHAARCHVP